MFDGDTQKLCVTGRSIQALVEPRRHRVDELALGPAERGERVRRRGWRYSEERQLCRAPGRNERHAALLKRREDLLLPLAAAMNDAAAKLSTCSLCGNVDRADDLVQETLLRALANIDSFQPGTNMSAWLFTILRNHFLNEIRRSSRMTDMGEGIEHPDLVARASQEDAVHVSDLESALHHLPEDRREALLLVGAGGFSYEEAAQVCGVPAGTIKSRVARGRAQLAAMLSEEGQTPSG